MVFFYNFWSPDLFLEQDYIQSVQLVYYIQKKGFVFCALFFYTEPKVIRHRSVQKRPVQLNMPSYL
jgi:hypothetical protein